MTIQEIRFDTGLRGLDGVLIETAVKTVNVLEQKGVITPFYFKNVEDRGIAKVHDKFNVPLEGGGTFVFRLHDYASWGEGVIITW